MTGSLPNIVVDSCLRMTTTPLTAERQRGKTGGSGRLREDWQIVSGLPIVRHCHRAPLSVSRTRPAQRSSGGAKQGARSADERLSEVNLQQVHELRAPGRDVERQQDKHHQEGARLIRRQ
jgi:hypothetical protein